MKAIKLSEAQRKVLVQLSLGHNAWWESGCGVFTSWRTNSRPRKSTLEALAKMGLVTRKAESSVRPHGGGMHFTVEYRYKQD